jgi:signal peptidase I
MASLVTFIVLFTCFWFVLGWALTFAARRLGATRGRRRLWAGLLVSAALIIGGLLAELVLHLLLRLTNPMLFALEEFILGILVVYMVLRLSYKLSIARTLALLGVYVLVGAAYVVFTIAVVRPYIAEAFVMPTQSMSPTLMPGDRFVVNKRLTPRRWDVVAYRVVDPTGPTKYAKRLVGMPGERLRFEGTVLYVNDQRVERPASMAGDFLPEQHRAYMRYGDRNTIELGPDEVFLAGDDLAISKDSRYDGPSKWSDVAGVADLRYWPLSDAIIG